MTIEIKEVKTKKELKQFVEFPNKLYADNQYYVAPLTFDEINTLRADKNPAFEYNEACYWLAYKDNNIVGRIAGIINKSHNIKTGQLYARFGWVDFIDDLEVSKKLFDTYENWARQKGMTQTHGPLGFTDLDREGMLIEGFEEMGSMNTYYNYPYYQKHLETFGYGKAAEWIQFELDLPPEISDRIASFAEIIQKKYELRPLRAKKAKDLLPYTHGVFDVIDEAYSELYGVVPLTPKQVDTYIDQYFGFIDPDFVVVILDKTDRVVAFAIAMPSLSKALRKANGRLFPFGFIHIYKALKKNDTLDLYLIGSRKEYHSKGITAIIFNEMHNACLRRKVKKLVSLPQLENNHKVLSNWKYYNIHEHIRRRCFIKNL